MITNEPYNCPYCGSTKINSYHDAHDNLTTIKEFAVCLECKNTWHIVYVFSGIEKPENLLKRVEYRVFFTDDTYLNVYASDEMSATIIAQAEKIKYGQSYAVTKAIKVDI